MLVKYGFFKKGISPVVAVALLLIVTVVAVINFQTWFGLFQSNLIVDVENHGKISGIFIDVEAIIGENLYITTNNEFLNVNKIELDGVNCGFNGTVSNMQPINISSCLEDLVDGIFEVLVVTDRGVISKSIVLQGGGSPSTTPIGLSGMCDGLSGEWVEVPADNYFVEENFCVMKYEAKAYNVSSGNIVLDGGRDTGWTDISDYSPFSDEIGMSWVDLNFTQAYQACSNLGVGYSLINNKEWMAIARNIENEELNWNTNEIGNGFINYGWANPWVDTQNLSSAFNGSLDCEYITFENSDMFCNSTGDFQIKRTHILNNGEIIWDFSGNVWSFVDFSEIGEEYSLDFCNTAWGQYRSYFPGDSFELCEFTEPYTKNNSVMPKHEIGPLGSFNVNNYIGTLRGSQSNVYAIRGGDWRSYPQAGIYNLYTVNSVYATQYVGFRCVFVN